MSIDYGNKKERLQNQELTFRKLNEIENKEVYNAYILILDCDAPLLLQDPSSFQFPQN